MLDKIFDIHVYIYTPKKSFENVNDVCVFDVKRRMFCKKTSFSYAIRCVIMDKRNLTPSELMLGCT